MTQTDSARLRDLVLRTIQIYNKYRSPEVNAKLVEMTKNGFVIDFAGGFCSSCGVKDYFEDFSCELEDLNKTYRTKITQTKPTGPQSFRVTYSIKDNFSVDVDDDELFREFLLDRGLSFSEYISSNACTKDVIMFHFRTWLLERKQVSQKKT